MKLSRFNIIHTVNGETYLYNSLTKASIKVIGDLDAGIDFVSNNISELQERFGKAFIEQLVSNGFIVDDEFDELKAIEYIYRKSFFDSSELTLILAPHI